MGVGRGGPSPSMRPRLLQAPLQAGVGVGVAEAAVVVVQAAKARRLVVLVVARGRAVARREPGVLLVAVPLQTLDIRIKAPQQFMGIL